MNVELYGGAISASLPLKMDDASNFREIPDTQEVFVASNGAVSVIFDLLEAVDAGNDVKQRVLEHFAEINRLNGVDDASVSGDVIVIPSDAYGPIGVVKQSEQVMKFNKDLHDITIYIAVVHLERAATDLVVTLNVEDTPPSIELFTSLISSIEVKDWSLFV